MDRMEANNLNNSTRGELLEFVAGGASRMILGYLRGTPFRAGGRNKEGGRLIARARPQNLTDRLAWSHQVVTGLAGHKD